MQSTSILNVITFDMATAQRGQEITEEVYNNFLNCMPPIGLQGGQGWCAGFQTGEPYCHRTDSRTGKWRPMFATFTTRAGRYFYQGVNFAGEVDSSNHIAHENDHCTLGGYKWAS